MVLRDLTKFNVFMYPVFDFSKSSHLIRVLMDVLSSTCYRKDVLFSPFESSNSRRLFSEDTTYWRRVKLCQFGSVAMMSSERTWVSRGSCFPKSD